MINRGVKKWNKKRRAWEGEEEARLSQQTPRADPANTETWNQNLVLQKPGISPGLLTAAVFSFPFLSRFANLSRFFGSVFFLFFFFDVLRVFYYYSFFLSFFFPLNVRIYGLFYKLVLRKYCLFSLYLSIHMFILLSITHFRSFNEFILFSFIWSFSIYFFFTLRRNTPDQLKAPSLCPF